MSGEDWIRARNQLLHPPPRIDLRRGSASSGASSLLLPSRLLLDCSLLRDCLGVCVELKAITLNTIKHAEVEEEKGPEALKLPGF